MFPCLHTTPLGAAAGRQTANTEDLCHCQQQEHLDVPVPCTCPACSQYPPAQAQPVMKHHGDVIDLKVNSPQIPIKLGGQGQLCPDRGPIHAGWDRGPGQINLD
ncbi:unnamed protein product [Pleuronectes platessa]|uniref:Uncharacterized protein n=1 Tax=Pleuronectes platessa TaxID=8262 RepID=A0A9N7Z149_PLEPL|nr:unnamed protein product [Pleuronectes platessa]